MPLDTSAQEQTLTATFGKLLTLPVRDDAPLDFTRPFLPEALAATGGLSFLDRFERRVLNQIRAHGYLFTLALVVEDVVPLTLGQMTDVPGWEDWRRRRMLGLAAAERRRARLPERLRAHLEVGIGTRCDLVGPASDVAGAVLAHQPLAAALFAQHLLWVAERHISETVRHDTTIDRAFKRLLLRPWLGAAMHLWLASEMVTALSATMTKAEIAQAGREYAEIGAYLEDGFERQVRADLAALARATGRDLSHTERMTVTEEQLRALRWTYLRSLA